MAELEKLQENNPTQRVMIPWKLDFSSQHLKESRNGFDMSVYKSNDGYSVENVFVAFIDSHSGLPLKGGNTEFSSEFPKTEFLTEIPVDEILADQKKYDDLLENYTKNDKLLTEQIIINSKICKHKHKFLKIGIISLIPFSILLLALIVLTII